MLSSKVGGVDSIMADDIPISFFPTGGLYLKNLALITVEVRLPEIRNPGVTVSNWEIMEKIKEKSKPEDYHNLRVALSARELIRFEGELETVRALRKVNLLLNGKTIKLRGFPDSLKIQAFQSDTNHPKQHQWEIYFLDRGVTSFEEGRPGERADTVHIKGLPVLWFASKDSNGKPCPKVLTDAFLKFGKVRQVGFYDPSNESSQKGFSSFGPGAATQVLNFEAYIQYEKYCGFCNATESLKNVQLLRLQTGGQAVAKIKVDFDRTGFLSDRGIRKRLHLEEKQRQEKEAEEKRLEERKREEEKRREEELKIKVIKLNNYRDIMYLQGEGGRRKKTEKAGREEEKKERTRGTSCKTKRSGHSEKNRSFETHECPIS